MSRPHEIRGRINAMAGARMALAGKSLAEAAETVGVNRSSISSAVLVLTFGTEEEIKAIESGALALESTADAVRARTPAAERAKARRNPTQTVLIKDAREVDASVWGHLREALDAITSLPSPKDTATIVRKNNMRIEHVNRKLLAAIEWIKEFENEVTL